MTRRDKTGPQRLFVAVDIKSGSPMRDVAVEVVRVSAFTPKSARHAMKGKLRQTFNIVEEGK